MSRPAPAAVWRLIALAAFLACLAAYPIWRRVQFDRINVRLMYMADLDGFRAAGQAAGRADRELLHDLKEVGFSAVAVRPVSSDQLAADKIIEYLADAEQGHTKIRLPSPDRFSIRSACAALFPDTKVIGDVVDVPAAGEIFRSTPMFLDHELIREAGEAGLEVAYRLPNVPWAGGPFLKHQIFSARPGSTIIFDYDSAIGWPASIPLVAEAFQDRSLTVGEVEFSGQVGVKELIAARSLESVYIHSIPPKEMAALPYSRLMPRWRRAADERNIRLFYVHPIPAVQIPTSGQNVYEANMSYARALVAEMARAGYTIGRPVDAKAFLESGDKARLSRILAAVAAASLTAAVVALLEWMPGFLLSLLWVVLALACAGSAKVAALAAAVSAPALSAILYERRVRRSPGLFGTAAELLLLFLLNCLGGALIYEILSDPAYVMHKAAFSGVKLVYLGPIAIAVFELVRRERMPIFRTRVTLLDLGLLLAVALVGVVYLLRSGNFSPIRATAAEQSFRDRLEESLPARPRTKEFAVGYPALALLAMLAASTGSATRANWKLRLLLLGAGTIAPVSIANAFCHIHTPLVLTVTRGAMGLAAGYAALLLLWPLRRTIALAAGGPYASLSGYYGYGNCGDEILLRRQLSAIREAVAGELTPLVYTAAPSLELAPDVRTAGRWSPGAIVAGMALSPVHVSGGGGLFQDSTGLLTVPYYASFLALHRVFGGRWLAMVGQSFGSLRRGWLRELVAFYASRADFVQTRDRASAANLREWTGGLEPDAGTDLLFWERLAPTQSPRKILGVNLREAPGVGRDVLAALAAACRQAAMERGLEVRFLAFHPAHDVPALADIAKLSEIVEVTPDNAAAVYSGLAAIVAMRYHAMLLAAALGTPLIALSYDSKTDQFLAESGHDAAMTREQLGKGDALPALLRAPWPGTERLSAWAEEQYRHGAAARVRFVQTLARQLAVSGT